MALVRMTSPHARGNNRTQTMMLWVVAATLPGVLAMTWFFGYGTLINILLASVVAISVEALILKLRKRPVSFFVTDGSALVTAWLLALALPPLSPWWLVAIAASFAIVFGKQLYGGLGQNPFNPAMLGYAVVLISFPVEMTSWPAWRGIEQSVPDVSATLGLLAIAPVGRLARATTIQYAEREFVVAARTIGASHRRIIVRELLPNVVIPMGALALLGVAVAIVAEGSLAFLGLSIEKGTSWGKLILFGAGGRDLEESPWIAFAPILFLFLTVASLNYAGDKLRSHFDVKESAL